MTSRPTVASRAPRIFESVRSAPAFRIVMPDSHPQDGFLHDLAEASGRLFEIGRSNAPASEDAV